MNDKKKLLLKFDPNTIDDLGAKLYSTLPPVLAELIANGYDAGASEIHIELMDNVPENKTIEIRDNGVGMSFDDINDHYLIIGRKKRQGKQIADPIFNRPVMGKKGLGKLSFFGITDHANIITRKRGTQITFEMDRNKIKKADSEGHEPVFSIVKTEEKDGTVINLRAVKRESTFDFEGIKNSLSNYFIFDSNFRAFVKHNDGGYEEITNDTRYDQLDIQFTWELPLNEVLFKSDVVGKVFTSHKPLAKSKRGIALISRKKLVNLPELFPLDTSSFFFQYLTGYLEVDFIDDLPEDVISTDRKTLNWGHPLLSDFKIWLSDLIKTIEKDWRAKRIVENKKNIISDFGVSQKSDTIRTDLGRQDFEGVIEKLAEANIQPEDAARVIEQTIPDFPELHYQHLYPELKEVISDSYEAGLYYTAVLIGVKRYVALIKSKTSFNIEKELDMISKAFRSDSPDLCVTSIYEGFTTSVGNKFKADTLMSIKEGHCFLAKAVWKAFRNPVSHEEDCDLNESGLYTVDDCLDALSLLSHLFRRLENSIVV